MLAPQTFRTLRALYYTLGLSACTIALFMVAREISFAYTISPDQAGWGARISRWNVLWTDQHYNCSALITITAALLALENYKRAFAPSVVQGVSSQLKDGEEPELEEQFWTALKILDLLNLVNVVLNVRVYAQGLADDVRYVGMGEEHCVHTAFLVACEGVTAFLRQRIVLERGIVGTLVALSVLQLVIATCAGPRLKDSDVVNDHGKRPPSVGDSEKTVGVKMEQTQLALSSAPDR